ncbi:MAG: hypothetical protein HW389_3033, partial [Bacteroidetes bacterium]|nr:hypothetical protein [Bacteroidota bacterium]
KRRVRIIRMHGEWILMYLCFLCFLTGDGKVTGGFLIRMPACQSIMKLTDGVGVHII